VRRPDGREAKVRRRQTGNRRQKTIGRYQEPGLKKDGLVSDDGWYKVLCRRCRETAAGELCRVSSSFLLSSAAGAQAATRDEARGEDCTLHSALKRQRVVVRREKERRALEGAMELKKSEAG
jgi:hypothetical protein